MDWHDVVTFRYLLRPCSLHASAEDAIKLTAIVAATLSAALALAVSIFGVRLVVWPSLGCQVWGARSLKPRWAVRLFGLVFLATGGRGLYSAVTFLANI